MILVAFVLVIVATVMLIIGTFFDAGTAYIWISIGACLATFVVLGISYLARRRGQGEEAARPEPLAGDAARSAPRSQTASAMGGGGTATMVREEPDTDDASEDEPSVTIVQGERQAPVGTPFEDEAAEEPVGEDTTADDAAADEDGPAAADDARDEETADADEAPAAAPAPRRVAPRRVVRRADVAATTEAAPSDADEADAAEATEAPPAPRIVATGAAPAAAPTPDEDASDEPATPAATGTTTRRVVRRAPDGAGGTRKVVRRVASGEGTRTVVRRTASGDGTSRRVVRRAEGQQPTRTVRRVVSPAAGVGGDATVDDESSAPKPASNRSGTRGKRARAVLSQIKGVGPAKQDALLKRFGSLEQMAAASVEDLAEVKGVGEAVATQIKQVLQDR